MLSLFVNTYDITPLGMAQSLGEKEKKFRGNFYEKIHILPPKISHDHF